MLLTTLLVAGVTVMLPAEATVLGSEITLGEIAKISGAQPDELARLQGYTLGYAPSPGYSRVLQDWKIEHQLRQSFVKLDIKVTGSSACRIRPKVAIVPGSEVESKAREALTAILEGEDVEIRLVDPIADESVPHGLKSRRLLVQPSTVTISSSRRATGVWSVPVQIVVDGNPYRTIWTAYEVTLFRTMPVLRRDIQKGEPIFPTDMQMKRAPLGGPSNQKPLEMAELAGALANKPLSMGSVVGRADVTRTKAIKKGEQVSLLVRKGTVVVQTYVTALQDAYIGDHAKVQIVDSTKELSVTVVAMGSVQLDMSTHNKNANRN